MADSRFCLQWNYHNKNICHGLTSLQQSGEFVDMTLAADGHHVKVHQMVLALASPYIKDLIVAANCPHPVIFLNQVSYKTLCSILEYIYSGQTLVSMDDISELLIAAKQLHIKGLEDVTQTHNETRITGIEVNLSQSGTPKPPEVIPLSTLKQKRKCDSSISDSQCSSKRATLDRSDTENAKENMDNDFERMDLYNSEAGEDHEKDDDTDTIVPDKKPSGRNLKSDSIQYSVSGKGVLKLIMNRYMYSIGYCYSDGRRKWRCNNRNMQCKALVVTKDNVVVRRLFSHNHPYHDKRIMRLVLAGKVFGTLPDAEKRKQTVVEKPWEPDAAQAEGPCERDPIASDPEDRTETCNTVAKAPHVTQMSDGVTKVVVKVPSMTETTSALPIRSSKGMGRDSTTPHKRHDKVPTIRAD